MVNSPQFKQGLQSFMARNPSLLNDKRFAGILKMVERSQKLSQMNQDIASSQESGMEQTKQTIETETGTVTMEKPPLGNDERKAIADKHGLRVSDVGPRGELDFGVVPQGMNRRVIDPATGNVIFEETTGDMGQLTTSQAGTITQTISKLGSGLDRISEIIPNVESIFGPANMLGEVVIDRTLSNFFPDLAEGTRISGRQLFRTFRESMFQGLSEGQGRLSDQDVERLRSLFPKEDTLIESPANAKIQLETFRQELGREIVEKAKLTGAPVPDKALASMSPKTLALMLQNGEITPEQFKIGWDQNVNARQKSAYIKQLQNGQR
jgi:hypothetical protein